MDDQRKAAVTKRLSQIPVTMQAPYRAAVAGRSKSLAIKSFCFECMGWDRAGVKSCTALACPLWAYRPGSKKRAKKRAKKPVVASPES